MEFLCSFKIWISSFWRHFWPIGNYWCEKIQKILSKSYEVLTQKQNFARTLIFTLKLNLVKKIYNGLYDKKCRLWFESFRENMAQRNEYYCRSDFIWFLNRWLFLKIAFRELSFDFRGAIFTFFRRKRRRLFVVWETPDFFENGIFSKCRILPIRLPTWLRWLPKSS